MKAFRSYRFRNSIRHRACREPSSISSGMPYCAMVQKLAQNKTKCIYTNRSRLSISKVIETALSNTLQVAFKSANNELKAASIYFLTQVLLKMKQNDKVDKVLDGSVERRSQLSTCTDAFASRALMLFSVSALCQMFFERTYRNSPKSSKNEKSLQISPFPFQKFCRHCLNRCTKKAVPYT